MLDSQGIDPSEWLWREISIRFGDAAADGLRRDYQHYVSIDQAERDRIDARQRYQALTSEERRVLNRRITNRQKERYASDPEYREKQLLRGKDKYARNKLKRTRSQLLGLILWRKRQLEEPE